MQIGALNPKVRSSLLAVLFCIQPVIQISAFGFTAFFPEKISRKPNPLFPLFLRFSSPLKRFI